MEDHEDEAGEIAHQAELAAMKAAHKKELQGMMKKAESDATTIRLEKERRRDAKSRAEAEAQKILAAQAAQLAKAKPCSTNKQQLLQRVWRNGLQGEKNKQKTHRRCSTKKLQLLQRV